MQGTRSRVDFLAPVTEVKVVETVTSLLIRLSGARDSFLQSLPSHDSCSRSPGLALCGPQRKGWTHWHRWLRWKQSLFKPAHGDVSSYSPSELSDWRSCHSRTLRNVDTRNVGACSSEASDLATVVWARQLSRSNADPSLWGKRGAGGDWLFLRLIRPHCLAPSCVVPSEPGLESFSKELNKFGLFILTFLPLILGVLSNAILGGIHGSPWVTQTFSKRTLELNPRQEIFNCLVFLTLELMPTKLILPQRNKVVNEVWLKQVTPAVYIKVIFTLLVVFVHCDKRGKQLWWARQTHDLASLAGRHRTVLIDPLLHYLENRTEIISWNESALYHTTVVIPTCWPAGSGRLAWV